MAVRLRAAPKATSSVAHDADVVGERQRLGLIMRDIKHGERRQVAMEPRELVEHRAADLRVERGKRLVEKQHLRPNGKSTRDRHALLLAPRKLARIALRVSFHADEAQAFRHALAHHGLARAPGPEAEGDILLGQHMWKQGVVLHHHADIAGVRRDIGHIAVPDRDPPEARPDEARHGSQRRRLSRAGRPDQRHDLAGLHLERQRIEDDEAAVGDCNPSKPMPLTRAPASRDAAAAERAGRASLAVAISAVNCR